MSFFNKDNKKKFITSSEYTICSKCGASMETNKRYCMKCGALNYNHPDNQYMKNYISDNEIEKVNREYFDGMTDENREDDVFVGGKKLKELKIEDKNNLVESKNYKAGFVYVLLLSLVTFGGLYFFLDIDVDISLFLSLTLFSILISTLSICNIYRKAGYSGFVAFVPFYSNYVLCDMLLDNGILFLLGFIPIVNIGFAIYILYKMGEKFGINGILSVLFFPIVILYIAFSDRVKFLGNVNDSNSKVFAIVGFLIMCLYLLVGSYFFYAFIKILESFKVL